jgi:type IV pilus assembly protein PilE
MGARIRSLEHDRMSRYASSSRTLRAGRIRHAILGFTLIELMITVVVVTILAAVALPSYLNSVRKGRRADASDGATAVLQAEERWRANSATYTTDFSNAGINVSSTTGNGYYTMSVTAASGTGYTLSFTPVSGKGQSNDTGCTAMTVTVANGSPTYSPSSCWSR